MTPAAFELGPSGQDYRTAKAAKHAFFVGKFFLLKPADVHVTFADFKPGDIISIRFDYLTKITAFTIPPTGSTVEHLQ